MTNLISFKNFIAEENINFVKEQISATHPTTISEALSEMKSLFVSISMDQLPDDDEGQRFWLQAETKQGTKIDLELSISDLMTTSFVNTLRRLSAN